MRTKGPSFLQPDQEIKNFHAPLDGEAVSDIAAKNGIHRRRDLEQFLRIQEHLDELFRVPGIDEAQINVHRTIHHSLVAGK